MSLFAKIFSRKKDPSSYAYRLERARAMHGQSIKYVTERRGDNDDVIGRGGALAVHGDTFIVDSSGDRLFQCNIAELEIAMLMSGDGAVVKGPDMLRGGEVRTVTVHFVYYRK